MIFVLIRIFPVLIPVVYFILLKGVFYVGSWWIWPLILALLLNFLYFLFIYIKQKKAGGEIFLILLHSFIFVLVGFTNILILGNGLVINLFLLGWSVIYLFYLESVFHYFYQTKKVLLLNLGNVISYVNLVTLFFLTAFLINFYVFINFSWWAVLLIIFISSFILILSRFQTNQLSVKKGIWYSFLISLMLSEIAIVALILPVSFYVSAIIISILYYLLTSLSVMSVKGELTKIIIVQYVVFTVIISSIIILTSQWL